MTNLSNKTVLVTGGAGSLGVHLVRELLKTDVRAVRVLDSNEYGHFLLGREFQDKRLRPLLGDIRDRARVEMAVRGVDSIIHAAALKNLEVTEYNVPEAIRTNVEGTVNLVELAMSSAALHKFLFVSSDKAVNSPTLYGSTKYVGEHAVLWANKVSSDQAFSCVRMGNFLEARGNVLELWKQQSDHGLPLTLTHPEMKRYYLPTQDAAKFVLKALGRMKGGEVFVPKMKEYSVLDMMMELYPKAPWRRIGLRPGEKMREVLLTQEEMEKAEELDDMWIVKEKGGTVD